MTEPPAEDGPHQVGVGPWEGPWPEDPRYDPELLRDGDRRNVVDGYRYWTLEAIVADLDLKRPIYKATAAYGHFGREQFPWEATNRVDELQAALA